MSCHVMSSWIIYYRYVEERVSLFYYVISVSKYYYIIALLLVIDQAMALAMLCYVYDVAHLT